MSHYFFDSSALAKRYIREPGTNWLRMFVAPGAGNIIIVASITQVEIISAVSRQKREGRISPRTAKAIRLLLERHCAREYLPIELTFSIVAQAANLLEQHPLRAYDAVQLATALESNALITAAKLPPLTFLSADNRLLKIAAAVGLKTDNPNNHP